MNMYKLGLYKLASAHIEIKDWNAWQEFRKLAKEQKTSASRLIQGFILKTLYDQKNYQSKGSYGFAS